MRTVGEVAESGQTFIPLLAPSARERRDVGFSRV
jgi:hypothetical protein